MAKKKKTLHTSEQQQSSEFYQAVSNSDLKDENLCKSGMQAVEKKDKQLIAISNVTGSLNLDKAKEKTDAKSNRWDYGFGYRQNDEEAALWVEVHHASTSEIKVMIKKLEWLKAWLDQPSQNELRQLTKKRQRQGKSPYIWVNTKAGVKFKLRSGLNQTTLLSQKGIDGPRRGINLP